MTLSLLIPSIRTRAPLLARLLARLEPQQCAGRGVEIVTLVDDGGGGGERTITAKRNELLRMAKGEYVAFIDDDDLVSTDYVASLVDALDEHRPDCVGFDMAIYSDGTLTHYATHSVRYREYGYKQVNGQKWQTRCPNHLNPVRVDFARQTAFTVEAPGEDIDYAYRLRPLLSREVFIPRVLYEYHWISPPKRTDGSLLVRGGKLTP